MQIAICDSSSSETEELEEYLKRYFSDKSLSYDITSFTKTRDLLYEIEDGRSFDIIFIENLPHDNNGINTAKKLRNICYSGQIIFLAQTNEYAVDGYDVNACGYIIRPIKTDKLYEVMDRATVKFSDDVYYIRHRGEITALPLNDILYIESSNTKCIIHDRHGKQHILYTQLRKIEEELRDPRFLRCHQSYLVNMNHICKASKCFELSSGERILIRQRNLKEIKNVYLRHIESK